MPSSNETPLRDEMNELSSVHCRGHGRRSTTDFCPNGRIVGASVRQEPAALVQALRSRCRTAQGWSLRPATGHRATVTGPHHVRRH